MWSPYFSAAIKNLHSVGNPVWLVKSASGAPIRIIIDASASNDDVNLSINGVAGETILAGQCAAVSAHGQSIGVFPAHIDPKNPPPAQDIYAVVKFAVASEA